MKKLFGVLVFVCLAIGAFAQTQTTVTASNIQQGGSLLASGQVCFQGTDGNNNPIPFRWLGGGQQGLYPFCATVTNGAIVGTLKVPNPQYTVPFNIPYTVRVQDASGNPVFTYLGVQFVGTTFNLDQYTPSNPAPIGYSANYFSFGTGSLTNYLDVNCIPSPSNPISPFIRIYCNNATTQFACLTSAGASCASSTVSLKFDGSDETSTIQTALKSAGYIYIPEKLISVSGISQAASGVVTTSTPHGLIAGDTIIPTTVLGMTQINGLPLTVSSVTDSTHFVVSTNTSGFGAYASGGVFPGIARINPTVGFCAIDNTYLRLDPGTYLKALANSVNQSSGYLMIGNCDPHRWQRQHHHRRRHMGCQRSKPESLHTYAGWFGLHLLQPLVCALRQREWHHNQEPYPQEHVLFWTLSRHRHQCTGREHCSIRCKPRYRPRCRSRKRAEFERDRAPY
jgi:hypothetical protein